MKITKEKELKIDYLTRQLNKNNTYSEDPNRKGDPKMGTKVVNLITDNSCKVIFEKMVSKWSLAATLVIV